MSLLGVGTHLDRFHPQLQGGVLVGHDHGVRVQLQAREGPHVVDALLDALLQSVGLLRSQDDGHHFAGLEDRLHADR